MDEISTDCHHRFENAVAIALVFDARVDISLDEGIYL